MEPLLPSMEAVITAFMESKGLSATALEICFPRGGSHFYGLSQIYFDGSQRDQSGNNRFR